MIHDLIESNRDKDLKKLNAVIVILIENVN